MTTLSQYLIQKLQEYNVQHIFGIPGDYVLNFYKDLEHHDHLKTITTCDEQGAGFAADAYARVNKFSCVVVTYGAGALKLVNTTAQAIAERSPVLVISGAPACKDVINDVMMHHRVKGFDTQYKIFQEVTAASACITLENAVNEIDRVFSVIQKESAPGYLEIPVDLFPMQLPHFMECHTKTVYPEPSKPSQQLVLEAMNEISRLCTTKQVVVIVGIEITRLGLQDKVQKFIEAKNVPFVSMLQSKAVISERHPNFLGVYEGAESRPELTQFVEQADCLIVLGVYKTDIDLGHFSANLDPKRTIFVRQDKTHVGYHCYPGFGLDSFLEGILSCTFAPDRKSWSSLLPSVSFKLSPGKPITQPKMFDCLSNMLKDRTAVIADTGTALMGCADLLLPEQAVFIGNPYYLSMGFAVPAAIGIAAALPDYRPVVLVGDGAFQMTGVELSTALRFNMNPIVILFNNFGYTTERIIQEGTFDDVCNWNYSKITQVLGGGQACVVRTEDEFRDAFEKALNFRDSFSFIEVILDKMDLPLAQKRHWDLQQTRR